MVAFNFLKYEFGQGAEKSTPPSWFPVTLHDNTESPEAAYKDEDFGIPYQSPTINTSIIEAHKRMMEDDSLSPYLAWAEVRGYSKGDLPVLMDMDCDSVDYLLDNPSMSPPLQCVIGFCWNIGVHPAYLQPCLRSDNHSYQCNIMEYIVDIALDEKAPQKDRELSYKAMEDERRKFENFEKTYPVEASYLKVAFADMEEEKPEGDIPETLQREFGDATRKFAPCLDIGLDAFEGRLKMAVDRVENLLDPERRRYEATEKRLLELASVLYGDNNSRTSLNKFLSRLRSQPLEFDEKIDWGYEDDATLFFETPRWKIDSPELHPNFEIHSKEWIGCKPDDVVAGFIDMAIAHVDRLTDYELARNRLKQKLDQVEWPLKVYQEWRKGEDAEAWQIPLFLNLKLVESVLGAKDKNDKPSLPALINPEIEKIFPHLAK